MMRLICQPIIPEIDGILCKCCWPGGQAAAARVSISLACVKLLEIMAERNYDAVASFFLVFIILASLNLGLTGTCNS